MSALAAHSNEQRRQLLAQLGALVPYADERHDNKRHQNQALWSTIAQLTNERLLTRVLVSASALHGNEQLLTQALVSTLTEHANEW